VPTKEDVFEQMVGFTLSERYMEVKELVGLLLEKARPFLESIKVKSIDFIF